MKILVTGSDGFIGKNLCLMLKENGYNKICKINRNTSNEKLKKELKTADFVYHLAGINRHNDPKMFDVVNIDFTKFILDSLKNYNNNAPVMFASSTQVNNNSDYGKSKLAAEKLINDHSKNNNSLIYIYRLPNIFGKWCKPNYNSFVSTFCHNFINDKEIVIHDENAPVSLVYIDDLCNDLIKLLKNNEKSDFRNVKPQYNTTVGEVANIITSFKDSKNLLIEDVGSGLTRALYSTYLSYLEPLNFKYTLPSYKDERGIFCEMLKTKNSGQFSFFTAYPGITRGGHYHHSKNEKFLVIKGTALFNFKNIVTGEKYSIEVTSEKCEVVITIPGWSHDIKNIGDDELIVMLWANEIFDKENPDTLSDDLSK